MDVERGRWGMSDQTPKGPKRKACSVLWISVLTQVYFQVTFFKNNRPILKNELQQSESVDKLQWCGVP